MIYDGSVMDTTNFASERYIEINSCNTQYNMKKMYTVKRDAGRVDYHILYVIDGECLCVYRDKEYLLKKGQFVLYLPKEKQRYIFMEGTAVTTMWVHFSGVGVKGILEDLGLTGGVHSPLIADEAEHCFKKMIYNYSVKSEKHRVASEASLMELLSVLAPEPGGERLRAYPDAVKKMIEYLSLNWQRNVSVAELASQVYLSESRAAHLFRATVGESIHRYVISIRIDTAKELLFNTDMSIAEIGRIVGFDDPLYFSRLFKSEVGLPPGEYRKKA